MNNGDWVKKLDNERLAYYFDLLADHWAKCENNWFNTRYDWFIYWLNAKADSKRVKPRRVR